MVNAYQKHRAAFLVRYGGWFDVNDNDINRRIRIHLEAKNEKKCSVGAWLNDMDLAIWSMDREQTVYVAPHGARLVEAFSGLTIPSTYCCTALQNYV